jgi:DNA-directed RNA polymerase specialized sigma24 family protein
MEEMQRRMGQGRRPELEAAARQACLLLKHLVPGSAKQDRPSKSAKTSPLLQEGQRKAVRAALLAGVAPGQVAKHFGLPLAAVRKVLTDAA